MSPGIRLSRCTPSQAEISVCPCSGNPYKRANLGPFPYHFPRAADRPQPSFRSNDRYPYARADSLPHGLDPPAGQAAHGHRGAADDRPCVAQRRAGADRPGGGRHRHTRNRRSRSEEHTSELQSREKLVCRLLLEKKKNSIYLCGTNFKNYIVLMYNLVLSFL